jgi:hypothetical protein
VVTCYTSAHLSRICRQYRTLATRQVCCLVLSCFLLAKCAKSKQQDSKTPQDGSLALLREVVFLFKGNLGIAVLCCLVAGHRRKINGIDKTRSKKGLSCAVLCCLVHLQRTEQPVPTTPTLDQILALVAAKQEQLLAAIPPELLPTLRAIAALERLALVRLGTTTDDARLALAADARMAAQTTERRIDSKAPQTLSAASRGEG